MLPFAPMLALRHILFLGLYFCTQAHAQNSIAPASSTVAIVTSPEQSEFYWHDAHSTRHAPSASTHEATETPLPPEPQNSSLSAPSLHLDEQAWLLMLQAQAQEQTPTPLLHSGLGLKQGHGTQSLALPKDPVADLVFTAISLVGTPYLRGGNDAQTGFDCSGFVQNIFADTAQHSLPRVARDQAQATQKIKKSELRPGDLVFFNTMRRAFSHVGIYIGEGKFIHSPSSGKSVRVESMQAKYWTQRFNGARRVF